MIHRIYRWVARGSTTTAMDRVTTVAQRCSIPPTHSASPTALSCHTHGGPLATFEIVLHVDP